MRRIPLFSPEVKKTPCRVIPLGPQEEIAAYDAVCLMSLIQCILRPMGSVADGLDRRGIDNAMFFSVVVW